MIDLRRIRGVALDIAGAGDSYDYQDELSEFIWHLLERHYRIYLFTTDPDQSLDNEDFTHPNLAFLRDEMPPSQALLKAHPALGTPETLWVTRNADLQRWMVQDRLPFMYTGQPGPQSGNGERLAHLGDLGALLDPTGMLLDDLVRSVDDLRRERAQGAILLGIGGPPLSGFQQFAVDLRRRLQDGQHELVELLDLTSLMRTTEALLDGGGDAGELWVSAEAGNWVRDAVLAPLRAGADVYVQQRPPALPADFDAHFPLFISKGAVVLIFAELVFVPLVADALDLSLLLDVSDDETTRRLFEIPPGERFDPKFSEQYQRREGRIYESYLVRHRVREKALLHIDANQEGAFRMAEGKRPPLV